MHPNRKFVARIALGCFLVFVAISQTFLWTAKAETVSNYWVTVSPTTADSSVYTAVGRNWTISFEALWTYGSESGQPIRNATVTVQVASPNGAVINKLQENTNAGTFSFNYSSPTADILTFSPTKLVTQDGVEWNSTLLESGSNLYGFQSKSVTVWWDTFHVALVSYDTNNLGATTASVNVTYLLVPEAGLTLPAWATYSNQTFLPKIAHGINVTINSVKAQETSVAGIYTANVSTWTPTAYILVGVSQEGWTTTNTGFSFTHNSNGSVWGYAILVGAGVVLAILLFRFVLLKKTGDAPSPRNRHFPVFGGILLAATSVMSLYWGLVALDGKLHGFDWALLSTLGLLSFVLGSAGAIMRFRKKNQAFAIFTVIVPLLVNLVIVKTSLEAYQLATPWIAIVASLVLSAVSGVLICNSDEHFLK